MQYLTLSLKIKCTEVGGPAASSDISLQIQTLKIENQAKIATLMTQLEALRSTNSELEQVA